MGFGTAFKPEPTVGSRAGASDSPDSLSSSSASFSSSGPFSSALTEALLKGSLGGTAGRGGGSSLAGLPLRAASSALGARLSPAPEAPKRLRARTCLTAVVRMSVASPRDPAEPHAWRSSPPSASTAEQAKHQLSPKCGADWPHLLHLLVIHLEPECYPNDIKVKHANSPN